MKISFIKYEKDNKDFNIPKLIGMNVIEIHEPEEVDFKIEELRKQKYTTVVISNELASFSQNIIDKYKYDTNFKIIITPTKI